MRPASLEPFCPGVGGVLPRRFRRELRLEDGVVGMIASISPVQKRGYSFHGRSATFQRCKKGEHHQDKHPIPFLSQVHSQQPCQPKAQKEGWGSFKPFPFLGTKADWHSPGFRSLSCLVPVGWQLHYVCTFWFCPHVLHLSSMTSVPLRASDMRMATF